MEDIIIPSGWDAKIEGNKVVFVKKESEDEKIRKDLINLIEWLKANPNFCSQYYKDRYGEMLAYLEKQEEQKPEMIQWTGKNLKEVINFTGKSPKFDEWFKSWEDFENYVHNHDDILKLFCEDGSHYEVPVGAWIVKTPDGQNVASKATFVPSTQEKEATPSEPSEAAVFATMSALKAEFTNYEHFYQCRVKMPSDLGTTTEVWNRGKTPYEAALGVYKKLMAEE